MLLFSELASLFPMLYDAVSLAL